MNGKRLHLLTFIVVTVINYAVSFLAMPIVFGFVASALGAESISEIESIESYAKVIISTILFVVGELASLSALLQSTIYTHQANHQQRQPCNKDAMYERAERNSMLKDIGGKYYGGG